MARIPYSGLPDVQQQGPAGAFERTQATPQEFGSGVGQAEQGLAQSGEKLGNVIAENAVRLEELTQDRNASQAINKYAEDAGKEWATYGAMEGQAAHDYYPTFQKNLAALRNQYGTTLQSPFARQKYDQYSRFMTSRWLNQGATHAASGLKQSYKTTYQQDFDSALQQGILQQNDMPSVAMGAARASDALRKNALLDGMTDQQAEGEAVKGRSQYYQRLFHDMLSNPGSVGQAASMYQAVRPTLDGQSILTIDGMMKPVLRKQYMDGWVNSAMGGTAAGFVKPGTPFTPPALPPGISLTEDAMVRTVAGEAAGEPLTGQRAVAAVIKNRAESSGADPRDVVFAPNQFEPWNGGAARQRLESMDPTSPQYQKILTDVVRPIMSGEVDDPTGGATHFYAPKAQAQLGRSAPSWATGTPTVIGNHNFYKVGYGPGSAAGQSAPGVINPQKSPAEMEFPDEQEITQKALRDFDDPYEQQQVMSAVRSRFATLNAAVKRDRDALSATIPQMEAQALDGHDIQIPEAQIRHVYPPEKAAELIESLAISKVVAPQFAAVKFGTPDDVAQAEARLSTNLGMGAANPETAEIPDLEGSNEAYRMRQSILRKFQTAVNARHAALNGPQADPAAYIATAPLMQQSLGQLGAPMPSGLSAEQQQAVATQRAEKFVQDSVSFQRNLGVRMPHVLTRADAEKTVSEIANADPATADVGQMLAGKARAYGQAWPQVFGDLVSLGKLSPEYQTLAQIESPVARANFQRMLKFTAEKGGREELYKMVGPPNMQAVNSGIQTNQALLDFQKTAQIPGLRANLDQINQVTQAVRDLAAFYSLPGGGSAASHSLFGSAPSAIERAANEIIGDKYQFDTTDNYLRVPVAQTTLRQVQDYGDALRAALKAEDLQGGGGPVTMASLGIAPTEDQATAARLQRDVVQPIQLAGTDVLGTIRRTGKWVTNESDSGAYLIAQDTNGIPRPVRKADGSRIEFSWKDARSGPPVARSAPAAYPAIP